MRGDAERFKRDGDCIRSDEEDGTPKILGISLMALLDFAPSGEIGAYAHLRRCNKPCISPGSTG